MFRIPKEAAIVLAAVGFIVLILGGVFIIVQGGVVAIRNSNAELVGTLKQRTAKVAPLMSVSTQSATPSAKVATHSAKKK